MRILAAILVLSAFAWAGERDEMGAEIRAAQERLHAMLAEAEELEQLGRNEEAGQLREQAAELERKIHELVRRFEERAPKREPRRPEFDDPLVQAIHGLEISIVALRKAGHGEAARDLEIMADRLRAQRKEREHVRREAEERLAVRGWDPDFERRTLDIYRLAMKALAEAEKRDAADLVERAIHARELLLSGRQDEEARRIIAKSPDDMHLGKLLLVAAELWHGFKQPERAERCEELGRFLQERAMKRRASKTMEHVRGVPERSDAMERIERLEARLERMEHLLHELLARMEEEREHR